MKTEDTFELVSNRKWKKNSCETQNVKVKAKTHLAKQNETHKMSQTKAM